MFFSYLYNINGYMSEWYEKKKHILASLVLGTLKSQVAIIQQLDFFHS